MTTNISEFHLTEFDPIVFMYLNPQVDHLTSVQQATDYWTDNSNDYIGRCNLDYIPSDLDPSVFITGCNATINASTLNQDIKKSMLSNGLTVQDIYTMSTYDIPTIGKYIKYIDKNTFQFQELEYKINYNLSSNDDVKIITDYGIPCYKKIVRVDTDLNHFEVNNTCNLNLYSSNFLSGIKLYDPLRLARIKFLDIYLPNLLELEPVYDAFVNVDQQFNYELYKILYPDSRALTKEEALIDYITRYGNNDVRIGNTLDIELGSRGGSGNIYSPIQSINYLSINTVLNLDFSQDTGRVTWNGTDLYYVTDDPNRPLSEVSPYFQGLITELAIKTYINDIFYPSFTISNLKLEGQAEIQTMFSSNIVSSNISVQNLFTDNLALKSVCIGQITPASDPMFSTINVDPKDLQTDMVNINKLQVLEGMWAHGSNFIYGSLAGSSSTFQRISGFQIGVGSKGIQYDNDLNVRIQNEINANISTISGLIITGDLKVGNTEGSIASYGTLDSSIHTCTLLNAVNIYNSNIFSSNITTSNLYNNVLYNSNLYTSNLVVEGSINIPGGFTKCFSGRYQFPANTTNARLDFINSPFKTDDINASVVPNSPYAMLISIKKIDKNGMDLCFFGDLTQPYVMYTVMEKT